MRFKSSLHQSLLAVGIAFAALPVRAAITNAILFVTQVPMPDERNSTSSSNVVVSVVSALGNHLADTAHAGRGGDLMIRYASGAVSNLTRLAGYGVSGTQDVAGIAVRDPLVDWSATKAVFSMVVGSPASANDTTTFFWQLYEVTNFLPQGALPVITKVPNQPTNYNNVMPCYGTDGRIIFACDRPRDGSAHLYPALDEYNSIPSNSGLWSLDTNTGDLFQMDHSPSGDFNPFVDSFGRVIFSRWDHLVQDSTATNDRLGISTNGTFNYFDEATTNYNLAYRPIETFPEPRTFDTAQLLAQGGLQGNAINLFLPWMQNEDGTSLEILNHIGRHELLNAFRGSSFTNDPNLRQTFALSNRLSGGSVFINNLHQLREDPLTPGSYFGVDAPDFGTHAAGQIIKLYGPPGLNGEAMTLTNVTVPSGKGPGAGNGGIYRNPLPMGSGSLVASYTPTATASDTNIGTASFPKSSYGTFRLVALTNNASGIWLASSNLTAGFNPTITYWNGNTRVTQTNGLWELQPVEVVSRSVPVRQSASVAAVESQVFGEEGVDVAYMQSWLRSNNLALLVSRNVTMRDRADKEQPYNLRVPGGTQTLGTNTGKIYDIAYIQFMQADQLRGLTRGGAGPVPGRRVLAMPMHDFAATNFNVPVTNYLIGASRLGLDGSQATFVPARHALTHQTLQTNGLEAVRERYWLTYQPGEIRTCAVCHGLNTQNQVGGPLPTNPPAALRDLLRSWKSQTGYTKILSYDYTNNVFSATFSGPTTRATVLEAFTNGGTAWIPVATNDSSPTGIFSLTDPDSTPYEVRYYRGSVP